MDIVGFALAVLLIELTPGPNMAWLAGLAATEGRRAGFAAVAGVAIGLLANGVLAALGLAALLEARPGLLAGLRLAGAAMMVWLAVETWRGTGAAAAPRIAGRVERRAFVAGALINLLNPKAYLFFVVVAPQFLGGAALALSPALLLAGVSAAIATLIHSAIVAAGSRAQAWLADPARTRLVRRLFAVLILGIAVSFLLPLVD
ncbi:LysE family transporter [Sphingomonas changnyeongensis]|uniref:LysE family transporter n=1 Tax=Sphingomonas changnyeongensis TaxID=2698679 RepID=A0A7Z2S838_9SPHN|nr:LysE family translocator [Sphingomonas changnyeongensis]QHL91006.1 LysE family transporter [Sphingomonas changnyeongensis]